MDEDAMGDVINLRRVRKAQQRARADAEATVNRIAHGTPKHLKKSDKKGKQRADEKIAAHKLDPET